MPKIKVQRTDVLRKKEIINMIAKADPRMKCLIALLWAFGKRISENLMLQKDEIYTNKGYVFVRFHVLKKRKDKNELYLKKLSIKHPAVKYILEYLDNVKDGPLFPKLTRQLALYYLKKLDKETYLHLFRRSLATEMSERSCSVQQLMAWFDWVKPDVAMGYVTRGPGLTRELSERDW
jgi:integrase